MEEEVTQPDCSEQTRKLLKDIKSGILEAKESTNKIINKEYNINGNGISLLDIKCHTLLSYINNLTHIILKKCKFQSIKNDPSIERLVEQRTVLERIRPLEFKMKYQIDKLVKTALSGSIDPNDPDRFRATIDGLADAEDDEENVESDNDEDGDKRSKKVKDGVYVAPKVTAVPYDGDESRAVKKQKLLERAKKRALQSSVMQELREEYADTPVELQINTVGLKNKQSKYDYERQKYEEDYFTRLPVTKKDKHRAKQLSSVTLGKLGKEVTHFEDISALGGNFSEKSGNKRKKKFKGKNLKKKRKF
ncbi:neuroguidin [Acyrthosiphon pisum]|uniref:ACYPI009773 protein n=1 Tax=Acyrthosiphon pisum TaxID=7029 RepID=C4WVN3_ACYPI|nr:neuroguidin [Acyrthosiphon pisum]BAH71953.1 ACYPI009773 [Acyrthosiphon pisum]|eukprot:NP_001155815.1 neuroguidin [Acyrthosiphon pisum]